MNKGTLKFTTCFLAAGITFTGTDMTVLAKKNESLAGIGSEEYETETEETDSQKSVKEIMKELQAKRGASSTGTSDGAKDAGTQGDGAAASDGQAEDTSLSGTLAFAQCDEYVNIRTSAGTDGEVVGKIYNNGSATILGKTGDWYEVQTGNVTGYVSADYFVVGPEADKIAQQVAYNVATVHPDALMVRAEPDEDSEAVGMAKNSDQLEVVACEGDWMKVALGGDSYGYVNAYYVDYDTYYATGETLEEEQERLEETSEVLPAADQTADTGDSDQTGTDSSAEEQAVEDTGYSEEYYYEEPVSDQEWTDDSSYEEQAADTGYSEEYYYEEPVSDQTWTESSSEAQAAADAAYQNYLDAQAVADAAEQQADEQQVYDTAAAAQAAYQEYVNAQNAADEAAAGGDYTGYQEQTADTGYSEEYYYEEPVSDQTWTESSSEDQTADTEAQYTESYNSGGGQAIVDYALQFVGNPYVWGGTSLTGGVDCSGFTQAVFSNFGIGIPRTASSQSGSGTPVDLGSIQPGDLLFYEGGSGIGHVSIYMGNGQVVHASNSSTGIIVSDYGYRTPVSARRYW